MPARDPRFTITHDYPAINISGQAQVHLGDRYVRGHDAEEDAIEGVLKSLDFPERLQRYSNIQDQHKGTLEWILEKRYSGELPVDAEGTLLIEGADHTTHESSSAGHDIKSTLLERPPWDSFVDWLNGDQPIYWVSGKPGSGKSTLMKYLIREVQQRQVIRQKPHLILSYWFWEAGSDLQRTLRGCSKSLLYQIVEQIKNPHISNISSHSSVESDTLLKLQKALGALGDLEYRCLIFLDGLDEAGLDAEHILQYFQDIQERDNHVKLCISSRLEQLFVDELSGYPKLRLQDLNATDIDRVISEDFLMKPKVLRLTCHNKTLVQDIRQALIEKAQGVFIWVRLAIRSLLRGITNRDDEGILKRRLEELPDDIDKLYSFMLSRQNDDRQYYKESAALYFNLILLREMSLLEFCLAINDDARNTLLDPALGWSTRNLDVDLKCEDVVTWINARSAGLLEVDDCLSEAAELEPLTAHSEDKVQFIHRTARTYLMDTKHGLDIRTTCRTALDDLVTLHFESALVYDYVLFALCQIKIEPTGRMGTLHKGMFHMPFEIDEPHYEFGRKAEPVWNELMNRGIIMTDLCYLPGLIKPIGRREPVPHLQDGSIDLPALYCAFGWRTHVLRALTTNTARVFDAAHVSRLLLWVTEMQIKRMPNIYNDKDTIEVIHKLLDILIKAGADPRLLIELPYGESIRLSSLLGYFALPHIRSTYPEYFQRLISSQSKEPEIHLPTISCCDRLTARIRFDVLMLWGDFGSWGCVEAFDYICSADHAAVSTARVYVLYNRFFGLSGVPRLHPVSSTNSRLLLRYLKDCCFIQRPMLLDWTTLGVLNLAGPFHSLAPLLNFLKTFCEEKRPFNSLREALLFMGKEDEHIMKYADLQEQDLRRNGKSEADISTWKAHFLGPD